MITEVPIISMAGAAPKAARLPERISGGRRSALILGDAAVVLFVSLVALNGAPSRLAAAVVIAAIVCGIFWQCGYYRRSYAVLAHDEVYYACAGVLLAALPVAVVLSAVAAVPGISIALALIFSAIGTAAVHTRLHLERRTGASSLALGIQSITPGAWHDRESAGFMLAKRIFDVTLALLALVLTSPIILVAALAIFLETGSPVIFTQERVGSGGVPFWIFKFRTLQVNAGSSWVRPGDARITRIGAFLRRTSIDELPQLINVLRGEMSIVGPRPEMLEFANTFAKTIPNYEQRHVVAPGITGWAQLYYKRSLTLEDMSNVLPLDLFYVEHASVLLDTALVLKTAIEVISHRAV